MSGAARILRAVRPSLRLHANALDARGNHQHPGRPLGVRHGTDDNVTSTGGATPGLHAFVFLRGERR